MEEVIAALSGLSSTDNTPQKPRALPVKRPKDDGSPAKQKLFDEEYVIYCCVHVFLRVYLNGGLF